MSRTESQPVDAPLILVVDDNRSVAALAARILRRAGYRVVTAPDGAQAVEAPTPSTLRPLSRA